MKWPDSSGEIVWNISFTALCFLLPGFIIVVSYSKILQVGFITLSNWQTYQEVKGRDNFFKIMESLLKDDAFCISLTLNKCCGKT